MQRCVLAALAVAVVSHSDGDATLSLLQTAVAKHNQVEGGKKECRAAKLAFKELKTTMKADKQAIKDAKAALKAAKAKRSETKASLKDARAAKAEACVKDEEPSEPVNGGKIRACVAQQQVADFPRWKINPVNTEGEKHYSAGRAGEMYSLYGSEPKPQPITGNSAGNGFKVVYNVEDAWNVPEVARRDPDSKKAWDCETCGCQLGCNGYIRASNDLGYMSSADTCLEKALGTASCIGMKSITWINANYQGNGKCYCTAGTMLVTTTGSDPNNLIDAVHPSYKNQYSLTCMLPPLKKRGVTAHSTFTPGQPPKKIPLCTGGTPYSPAVQDHSEKSILLGNFGFDAKGRAACVDQSWKDKNCQKFATRMSYSKSGECRCEWGPLLDPNQLKDWQLNYVTPSNYSTLYYQWTTCLYPRDWLAKGTTAHAMWVR